MSHHSRTPRVLLSASLGAILLAAALPGAASGAPAVSQLRVEAGGVALAPGHLHVSDTARITTDTGPECGGTGAVKEVQGPTALGLIEYAQVVSPALRPFRVSDKFSFGLLVCGIGGVAQTDDAFWLYKANHVSPEVGGDQFPLEDGSEVLWYFQDSSAGLNTGDELALQAPARAKPGRSVSVRAFAYDSAGKRRPAAGVRIPFGQNEVVTGADGRATLAAGARGTLTLRAQRGSDIAAEPVRICVNPRLSDCPPRRGERIYGTSGADSIKGTAGADDVRGLAGNDRIDVSGGGRDRVRCGAGNDIVDADRQDRLEDCEKRRSLFRAST